MIRHPQFKAHFHVEAVPGEGVFLLSEKSQAVLRGRLYEEVAPLIDGRRSADDIAGELDVGKDHWQPSNRRRGRPSGNHPLFE